MKKISFIILFLSVLTLMFSCQESREVDVIKTQNSDSTVNVIKLDTNLFTKYIVNYKNGDFQTFIFSDKINLMEMLNEKELKNLKTIDTIQYKVSYDDLY